MRIDHKPTFLLSAACCLPDCKHQQSLNSNQDHFPDGCVFQVAWSINPHMKVGAASSELALKQHANFIRTLRDCGADIITLPFVHGAYDSVFIKDSAIVKNTKKGPVALITRPHHKVRAVEADKRRDSLFRRGFKIAGQSEKSLEGGDVVVHATDQKVFMGYGFRTEPAAAVELARFFEATVIPLELKDPHFYHLDVALSILSDGTAFACREAFTEESWKTLNSSGLSSVIPITKEEALKFSLNWVEVGKTVVLGSFVPRVMDILKGVGRRIRYSPLDQFQLAGGSAACLVSRVHNLDPSALQKIRDASIQSNKGHEGLVLNS